jgi:hypothetical protein
VGVSAESGLMPICFALGLVSRMHVKSEQSHRIKLLLNSRRLRKRKLLHIENDVSQSLNVFALMDKSRLQRSSFVQRIRALVDHDSMLKAVMDCMLNGLECSMDRVQAGARAARQTRWSS